MAREQPVLLALLPMPSLTDLCPFRQQRQQADRYYTQLQSVLALPAVCSTPQAAVSLLCRQQRP